MIISNKEKTKGAKVDTDIIAFHVTPEEEEYITEHMVSAIVANCLIEFGMSPEIFG